MDTDSFDVVTVVGVVFFSLTRLKYIDFAFILLFFFQNFLLLGQFASILILAHHFVEQVKQKKKREKTSKICKEHTYILIT